MGLLDNFSQNLDDPKSQFLIQLGLGLLQPSQTKIGFGGQLSRAGMEGLQGYANTKQAQLQQQTAERANRASDLQQLQTAYMMERQANMPQIIAAAQSRQPYTPSAQEAALQAKLSKLIGLPMASGSSGAPQSGNYAPVTGSGALPPAPQIPPPPPQPPAGQNPMGPLPGYNPAQMPQRPPQAPQQPAPPSGAFPDAGGQPAAFWLGIDQTGKLYAEQLAKDNAPVALRQGDLVGRGPDGNYKSLFQQPPTVPGVAYQRGPDGQVSNAAEIPNFRNAAAGIKGTEAAATANATLPYQKPDVIQTKGAPTLMTVPQQIQQATGAPPPNPLPQPPQIPAVVPPATQTQRNAVQIAILQKELANTANPSDRSLIQAQLRGLQGAQATNQPFNSMTPPKAGLELQDQTDAAAQAELGKGMGTQAVEVFKNGAASIQQQKLLGQMSNMAQNFTPGVFQPLKAQFGAYLVGAGIPSETVNKTLGTNVGSIQALTSAAIQMAGKLTRQTDAQPSQLQFLKTLESMPAAARTADGFQKIMQYLNDSHQYNIDKMVAQQQWLDDPAHEGSVKGFEAAWVKQANTQPYVWNTQSKPASGGWSVKRIN